MQQFRAGAGFPSQRLSVRPHEDHSARPQADARAVRPGIQIPLRPFFGSMGVAPPSAGRLNSGPPWMHAGNMDNKELVAGTTLYIPVHAPGALFEVGDGHAGQGNGEVDITAMETALVGTFEFVLHKGMPLKWPRGETPTHYITMGIDKDLNQALVIAVRETI